MVLFHYAMHKNTKGMSCQVDVNPKCYVGSLARSHQTANFVATKNPVYNFSKYRKYLLIFPKMQCPYHFL